jgi:hypothetical protein
MWLIAVGTRICSLSLLLDGGLSSFMFLLDDLGKAFA